MSEEKKRKGLKAVCFSTVTACALVFAFVLAHVLSLKNAEIASKNAEIALLERQVQQLSDVGAVPEAVADLKSDFSDLRDMLVPLTIVTS